MRFKLPWTVCRVCLREGRMYSLFQKDAEGMAIADKLSMFTDTKVVPDRALPEEICRRCMVLLNSAYVFQIQCKKSEFLLRLSVKHKKQQKIDHETVYLTLKNGKIVQMPKGVTLKKNSTNSNTSGTPVRKKLASEVNADALSQHSGKSQNAVTTFINISPLNLDENKHSEDTSEDTVETSEEVQPVEILQSTSRIAGDSVGTAHTERAIIMEENDFYIEEVITDSIGTDSQDCTVSETLESTSHENTAKKKEINIQILRYKESPDPEKSKIFICELCGNRYKSKTSFDIHMRIHRNERPYKCEICHVAFVQNSKLTIHMRKHTGERPYACSFCPRRFMKKESKSLHERMHTGEKPYECDVCGLKFSYSCVLIRHKVLHTSDKKNFVCEPCGKSFRFKYHLSAHLKTSAHQPM